MKHRVFIAINLPETAKNKFVFFQNKIDEFFSPFQNELSGARIIKWTKKENLHLTLLFLGDIQEEELLRIYKIIEEAASRHHSFYIAFNEICYGPPGEKIPRMIWAKGERSEDLTKLQKGVEGAVLDTITLRLVGGYSPHITLARINKWNFARIEPEERPVVDENPSVAFRVDSIEIMESRSKRGGQEYTVIKTCNLKI